MAQPSTGLTFLGLGVILHHIAMMTGGWSAARRDGSGAGGPWAPCTSHSGCPGVVQAVRVTTVLGSLCSAVALTLAGMVWVSGARCTPQGIPRAVFGREISVPEVIAGAAAGAGAGQSGQPGWAGGRPPQKPPTSKLIRLLLKPLVFSFKSF